MLAKSLTTTSLIAALALSPIAAAPAQAQDTREIVGGLLLGGALVAGIAASQPPRTQVLRVIPHPNDARPQAQPPRPQAQPAQPRAPQIARPSIPVTEAGRQVQTALNYFGFDAGFVDGQVGRQTRAAVERYQAFQGYPVNGRSFPEPQAQHLINAYRWSQSSGEAATGLRGQPLLLAYGNVLNGAPVTPTAVNPAAPVTPPVLAVSAAPSGAGVPNLFAGSSAAATLSSRCTAVGVQSRAGDGPMGLTTMSNAGFALSEQFCIAREAAMLQGRDLAQAITGVSGAEIATQCEGFATAVAGQTALIGSLMPEQMAASARAFALTTGIAPSELSATARVCLGLGYREDDMAMVLGSAVMLVGSGDLAYGEIIGHHLREGHGVSANATAAEAWFAVTLTALERGAPAVFNTSEANRTALLRQAVAGALRGQAVPLAASVPAGGLSPQGQMLPTFQVSQ